MKENLARFTRDCSRRVSLVAARVRLTALRAAGRIRPAPQSALLDVLLAFWLSRAVFVAARLNLADAIGDGPTSLADAARLTGTRPENLRRLLRALSGNGIFRTIGPDQYAATAASDLLRSDNPESIRAFVETVLGHEHYEAWSDIEHSLRAGGAAFDHRFGTPFFEYHADRPEAERRFGDAMDSVTRATNEAILATSPISAFSLAVDVGGGDGALMRALMARNPSARGVVLDLPGVVQGAGRQWVGHSQSERLEYLPGDFFVSVPSEADLYLLKMILHDWKDDAAVQILRNIRQAIRPDGRLLVIEAILPETDKRHPSALIDLNMMVMTGGRERTATEYRTILKAANFRLVRTTATLTPFSVMEARPV